MGLQIHSGHIGIYGCLCTLLMPRCDATDNLRMFDNKQEPIYHDHDDVTRRITTKTVHLISLLA